MRLIHFFISMIHGCVAFSMVGCTLLTVISHLSSPVVAALNSTYPSNVIIMIPKTAIRVYLCVSVCTVCLRMCAGFFISKAAVCVSDWHGDCCVTFTVKESKSTVTQTHVNNINFQTLLSFCLDRIHVDRLCFHVAFFFLCLFLLLLSAEHKQMQIHTAVEICAPKIGVIFPVGR